MVVVGWWGEGVFVIVWGKLEKGRTVEYWRLEAVDDLAVTIVIITPGFKMPTQPFPTKHCMQQ